MQAAAWMEVFVCIRREVCDVHPLYHHILIKAHNYSQKYKEGKYILEKARITKVDGGLSKRRMELFSSNGVTYSDDQDSDDE